MGHGDRSGSWRGSRRSEIGVAEVGHGAGHGMSRGVGDRSGLKWVVDMANWSRRGSRRSEIGDRSGDRRLEIRFCCDAGFFFFFNWDFCSGEILEKLICTCRQNQLIKSPADIWIMCVCCSV